MKFSHIFTLTCLLACTHLHWHLEIFTTWESRKKKLFTFFLFTRRLRLLIQQVDCSAEKWMRQRERDLISCAISWWFFFSVRRFCVVKSELLCCVCYDADKFYGSSRVASKLLAFCLYSNYTCICAVDDNEIDSTLNWPLKFVCIIRQTSLCMMIILSHSRNERECVWKLNSNSSSQFFVARLTTDNVAGCNEISKNASNTLCSSLSHR